MRRSAFIAGGTALVVLAGGTAVVASGEQGKASPAGGGRSGPPATTEITRADLVDSKTVPGRLDLADRRAVNSGLAGTVTTAPSDGRTVRRGGMLYGVNAKPVTLMYGRMPAFRAMREGAQGPDVRQLEANLSALGYGRRLLRADDKFDKGTTAAVKAWRRQAFGTAKPGGEVGLGEVVFLPGLVRVSESKVALGDLVEAGKPVLTASGGTRIVRADLDKADEHLARRGAAVEVVLPGGDKVKGRIARIAKATAPQPAAEGGSDTLTLEITLSAGAGRRDKGQVDVELISEARRHVLTVPVEALVALREGGHGLEIVEGGRSRTVKVEPGLYADGRVEVTGAGLREGMKVGTISE